MSIIYSYPTVQPAADDLLIGTDVGSDNATKSFTISSIASLVGQIASAGTVTSVQIATDYSLSAIGGPIEGDGTITMGLATTGSPSINTFLGYSSSGQLQWRTPTVSAGIYAFNQNTQITDDISSINFRGAGVVASSAPDGSVTVQIDGDSGGVNNITQGTGISVNQTTGDVEITNTGVTRLTAGSNITLSANTGSVTISSSGGTGGVSIVNAGTGLTIESGTAQANPTIGVDYTGINNFIRLGEDTEVITADDFMLFEDVSTGDVKSTTLGTIPTSALTLVQDTINTTVSNPFVVKNNTDVYPSIPTVFQVITLTQAEYNAIATKDGNTLYLIGTGITQFTKTLAISNSIVGTQYTLGEDQVGATRTGAEGSAYDFVTTVTPNSGYEFTSGPTINNASGVFDNTGTVTTTISGTVSAIVPSNCTRTLTIVDALDNPDGAVLNQNYEFTSFRTVLTASCGSIYNSFGEQFDVAVQIKAGQDPNQWEIVDPIYSYSPESGAVNGAGTVTCTVTGTIREKLYTLQYNVTDSNTGGAYATDYLILNSNPSGVSFNGGTAPLTQTISGKFSDTYNIVTTYSNVAGSNNDTVISSVSEGTFNGKIISGITGTLGDSAPANVILNQTIASTTSAIAGPAQFRLTALTQSVQTVDDGDGVENKGITYAPYAQYKINNGPLNDITTLNQYILVAEGDLVTLSYPDPTVATNQGYFVKTSFLTNILITDGTSTVTNSFTAVADKSYDVTIDKYGGVTNRRGVQGRSAVFTSNESDACGLQMLAYNLYLSKPGTPLAPPTPWVPEVNDYTWDDDYAYVAFADGWYRANLTVTQGGTLPTNPGKYQLLSNRVNAASACPSEGTAILSLDDQVNGGSSSYTISSTYTVTPSGGSPGSPIPYANTPVTAIAGSTITFVTTVVADSGFYWSSGPTVTPAGNNSVTITADSQVQANVTVQGTTASLIQIRTSNASLDASGACGDDKDSQDAWKTGNSTTPIAGQILYGDVTRLNFADPGFYVILGQTQSFEVNSSGVISNVQNC
jgi:hypothetical protein